MPSPLEVTADHRAAFAALHRVLAALRDGDALRRLAGLRVLVYEVNHPGYPDLLVDVSPSAPRRARHGLLRQPAGAPRLPRARRSACGASAPSAPPAGRRWPRATAGSRSPTSAPAAWRSSSPTWAAARARREVREGPLVSVVVRTRDRPALLAEALGSLAASTYRRLEVVLVNDGGAAAGAARRLPAAGRARRPRSNRGRAAAANAGIAAASGELVLFLDDDDLVEPEHLATLVARRGAGERVAYTDAAVGVYELDAASERLGRVERRLPYSRDFDPDLLLVDNYIPFHTLLIERRLFAAAGAFDATLPFFEDWDFLIRLSRRAPLPPSGAR